MRRLFLMLFPLSLFGDGGTVILRQSSGPFLVTVFATPTPLRAGPVDLTVMVQDASTQTAVLDASVIVRVQPEAGPEISTPATRAQAQNKLLYAAPVVLPDSGRYKLDIAVTRGAQTANLSGTLEIAPPEPLLASHWAALSLPPLGVMLFALREWLVRRRKSAPPVLR